MASLVDFRTTFQAKKNTQTHFEGVSERFLPSGVANALVNKACDLPACQSRCEFLILLFDVPANPGLSRLGICQFDYVFQSVSPVTV